MCYAVGKSKLQVDIIGTVSKKQCVKDIRKKLDIITELARLNLNFKCCFFGVYFYENCATIDTTKGKILELTNPKRKRLKL